MATASEELALTAGDVTFRTVMWGAVFVYLAVIGMVSANMWWHKHQQVHAQELMRIAGRGTVFGARRGTSHNKAMALVSEYEALERLKELKQQREQRSTVTEPLNVRDSILEEKSLDMSAAAAPAAEAQMEAAAVLRRMSAAQKSGRLR